MEKLTTEDLKDIVIGATFLGSGGGGSPENGLKLVDEIGRITKEVTLVNPNEVPDGEHVAMIAGMGSPMALKEKGFGPEAIFAFEGLQKLYGWLGIDFKYIMPGETGGFNTITPIYVAAAKKLTIVDADGTGGRAVPDLETTLYYLYGIPTSPFVLADRNGNTVMGWTKDPMDAPSCENIARHVTTAFGMLAGLGTWVVSGYQIKNWLEPNVIAKSRSIGKAIREAREKGVDPVTEVTKVVNGIELIRGEIEKIETKTVAGFDFGRTTIRGIDKFEGKRLFIDFKNENMICWKALEEPVAIVPDLMGLITLDGNPLTNADTKEGMKISVIAVPASERWRKHPKCFEPWRPILEKMGYKGDYIPVEKLVG
ncbi:MAG: DUF917 domain-containing protein [Candidatus Hodarchaeaceae archaeon]|nr:DUF917 domain-containing protein [Candidatus Hodarchaeaceae archaeon]